MNLNTPIVKVSAIDASASVRKPYTKEDPGLAVKNEPEEPISERILVIEDNDALREILKSMLKKAGFKGIEDTGKGVDGLKLFRQNPFDLVITDIFMQDKDGLEIITELSRDYPRTKIIAVSGGGSIGSHSYLETAKLLGASRTLAKPFMYSELIDVVQEVLNE